MGSQKENWFYLFSEHGNVFVISKTGLAGLVDATRESDVAGLVTRLV